MTTYPTETVLTVAAMRPDLAAGDAIACVLMADPALDAAAVIDILDAAAADWALELAADLAS